MSSAPNFIKSSLFFRFYSQSFVYNLSSMRNEFPIQNILSDFISPTIRTVPNTLWTTAFNMPFFDPFTPNHISLRVRNQSAHLKVRLWQASRDLKTVLKEKGYIKIVPVLWQFCEHNCAHTSQLWSLAWPPNSLTYITNSRNLMHWLLFICKILLSSTCFEHQVLIFRRI